MLLLKVALVALLAFGHLVPAGQLLPAEVGPEQDSYSIAASAATTIVVRLENANDVYGIDVRASFDPALLEVVDADGTTEGIQVEAGSFPQPDFVAPNRVDPAAGTIRYVITQMNPTPPANGGGTLFTVQLRGRSASGTGEFRIDEVEMSDRDGRLLPVNVSAATVEVAGTNLTGAHAEPTGVAMAATTEAAAQPTPTELPTQAAQSTATTAVAQRVATQASATAQPAAQTEGTVTQADAAEGAAAPTTPAAAGAVAQPTSAAAVIHEDSPASVNDSVAVATPGESRAATVEEVDAAAIGFDGSESIAEANVAQPPAPDVAVIGDGQAVVDASATDVSEASGQGESMLWPILLALGVVAVLAGLAFIYNRRPN